MESKPLNKNSAEPDFDILFYRCPQPMWIYEIGTIRFLEVNDAAIEKYKFSKDEFLNMTLKDIRPPEDLEQLGRWLHNLPDQETNKIESAHVLKTGEVIYVEIVSYPINFKGLKSRLVHAHDITDKVNQHKLIKTITDNTTAALFMINTSGVCTFMNPVGQRMFGYSFEEISLQPLHYLIHHHHADGSPYLIDDCPVLHALVANEPIGTYEDVFFRKDGTAFPALCTASPIYENGKPISTVVEIRDITMQKQLEAAQVEAAKAMQESLEKREEFMSIASHELKTPITSMKGYLQLMEKLAEKESNPLFKNFIPKANRQVDKLTGLVSELLDISKIDSGKMIYNFNEFKVSDLLEDCITFARNTSAAHQVSVSGDPVTTIHGDKNRLEQVVCNLLSNAIKYSPDAPDISIRYAADTTLFSLEITDSGPGIPDEKLSLIFERFYRGEENSFRSSGLGLGLFISAEIIKRHGGNIGARSQVGKGSTFWFNIPVRQRGD
ncbi:PAS domain-containing sensor histidine kinase [Rubrolithibacter danxiaensis]|uniref:PAS domain-containing sensor histidine kinase n=1 Tax=Rubrolithibacter danxiaensis TaxID=3390805 RepID=UPI003BF8515B